jgi:hypothetical protein
MTTITNEQIVSALAQHGTVGKAAQALGMPTRTLYDRMRKPSFRVLYEGARLELIQSALNHVQGKVSDALNTVSEIMADKEAPHSVRLQAAQCVIQTAMKFADRLTLTEQRVLTQQDSVVFEDLGIE